MNRLTKALNSNDGTTNREFDVPKISYDLNGNIKNLQRRGTPATRSF